MRKIQGNHHLMSYLDAASCSMLEEKVCDLIEQKTFPHKNPGSGGSLFLNWIILIGDK
jgi:hypothetical protein